MLPEPTKTQLSELEVEARWVSSEEDAVVSAEFDIKAGNIRTIAAHRPLHRLIGSCCPRLSAIGGYNRQHRS